MQEKKERKSGLLMYKIEGRYSAGAGIPPSLTTERMGKGGAASKNPSFEPSLLIARCASAATPAVDVQGV